MPIQGDAVLYPFWLHSPLARKKYSNTVLFGVQVFKTCKYCKEVTPPDCWGSEEWSSMYGETVDDRESMRMAEFGYYTSDPETDDELMMNHSRTSVST